MRMGNVMPYSFAKFVVDGASSWEIPRKVAPPLPYRLLRRSRKGNVNWQTGQEILKNAATTGPRSSRVLREYCLMSRALSENPGAMFPATMCVIWSCFPIQRESRRRIPIGKVYPRKVGGSKMEKGSVTIDSRPERS